MCLFAHVDIRKGKKKKCKNDSVKRIDRQPSRFFFFFFFYYDSLSLSLSCSFYKPYHVYKLCVIDRTVRRSTKKRGLKRFIFCYIKLLSCFLIWVSSTRVNSQKLSLNFFLVVCKQNTDRLVWVNDRQEKDEEEERNYGWCITLTLTLDSRQTTTGWSSAIDSFLFCYFISYTVEVVIWQLASWRVEKKWQP